MTDKAQELLKRIEQTESNIEFDIVADLKALAEVCTVLKPKAFKQRLLALIEKYQSSEAIEMKAALIKKCKQGDTTAMRLYFEKFAPEQDVNGDDGLIEAIKSCGKGAFDV